MVLQVIKILWNIKLKVKFNAMTDVPTIIHYSAWKKSQIYDSGGLEILNNGSWPTISINYEVKRPEHASELTYKFMFILK